MPSTAPSDAGLPPKPTRVPSTRPPTLTELAARMSERSPSSTSQTGPSPSASRPRLPAALLARTNSQQGASSATGSARSPDSAGADSNTESLVEKLASASLEDDKKTSENSPGGALDRGEKAPRGYKNIPSLNEITERLGGSRTRSSDSPAKVTSETTAFPTKAEDKSELEEGEIEEAEQEQKDDDKPHPLQHNWQLYHDCKSRGPGAFQQSNGTGDQSPFVHPPNTASGDYEAGLTTIGEFNTVEDFCRYFNWLKPPSQLERNSNYHLFKDGIKPMWEDPANANGGKWVLTMKSNPELLDRCWAWLAMALVGEDLDEKDEICGAVVSLRAKIDRIQLWLRTKEDIERINSIGRKLVKLLDLQNESGIGLEFQYNTEDRPTHTKFISIQPAPQSTFRSRGPGADGEAPPASAPGVGGFSSGSGTAFGGGMGNFTTGGGGGWRSRAAAGAAGATALGGAGRSASAFLSHSRSNSAGGSAGPGQA